MLLGYGDLQENREYQVHQAQRRTQRAVSEGNKGSKEHLVIRAHQVTRDREENQVLQEDRDLCTQGGDAETVQTTLLLFTRVRSQQIKQ